MNNTSENINVVTRSALVISFDLRSRLVVINLELDTINVILWLDVEHLFTKQIVLSWQSLSLSNRGQKEDEESDNLSFIWSLSYHWTEYDFEGWVSGLKGNSLGYWRTSLATWRSSLPGPRQFSHLSRCWWAGGVARAAPGAPWGRAATPHCQGAPGSRRSGPGGNTAAPASRSGSRQTWAS